MRGGLHHRLGDLFASIFLLVFLLGCVCSAVVVVVFIILMIVDGLPQEGFTRLGPRQGI